MEPDYVVQVLRVATLKLVVVVVIFKIAVLGERNLQ
jgi:hypothetical protein